MKLSPRSRRGSVSALTGEDIIGGSGFIVGGAACADHAESCVSERKCVDCMPGCIGGRDGPGADMGGA